MLDNELGTMILRVILLEKLMETFQPNTKTFSRLLVMTLLTVSISTGAQTPNVHSWIDNGFFPNVQRLDGIDTLTMDYQDDFSLGARGFISISANQKLSPTQLYSSSISTINLAPSFYGLEGGVGTSLNTEQMIDSFSTYNATFIQSISIDSPDTNINLKQLSYGGFNLPSEFLTINRIYPGFMSNICKIAINASLGTRTQRFSGVLEPGKYLVEAGQYMHATAGYMTYNYPIRQFGPSIALSQSNIFSLEFSKISTVITSLVRPGDDTVVSPDRRLFTLTNHYEGPKSRISYEVDIKGPNISQINNLGDSYLGVRFMTDKEITVDIFGKSDFRLAEGRYLWRARATTLSSGLAGPWSDYRSFVVFGGVDLSAANVPSNVFTFLKSKNWSFVIVDGFGGRTPLLQARKNLLNAAAAGFTHFGVYCYLNFDNKARKAADGMPVPRNQTGDWQVRQALFASGLIGTNKISLIPAFVAIDVEMAYKGTMSPAKRVERIAEAVKAVRDFGFKPVIYARDDNKDWSFLTGSIGMGGSVDFADIPIWVPNYYTIGQERFDDLQLDVNPKTKPRTAVPWTPFGGWKHRQGKQYFENQPVPSPKPSALVDLNVFDPAIFGVTY